MHTDRRTQGRRNQWNGFSARMRMHIKKGHPFQVSWTRTAVFIRLPNCDRPWNTISRQIFLWIREKPHSKTGTPQWWMSEVTLGCSCGPWTCRQLTNVLTHTSFSIIYNLICILGCLPLSKTLALIHVLKRSIKFYTNSYCGPGYVNRYSDSLRAGRSRDRIPAGVRFFVPVQSGPAAHSVSYKIGTWSLSWG